MWRTALPCTSFKTTIGMFVTGSIIKPRILISTSMVSSRFLSTTLRPSPQYPMWCLVDVHADQAVRRGTLHLDGYVAPEQFRMHGEDIHNAVARRMAAPLIFFPRLPFHVHFEFLSEQFLVCFRLNFSLQLHQHGEAAAFFFFRNGVGHGFGGSVRARRIFERKNAFVFYGFEEAERFRKFSFGCAGETDDDVGGDRNWALRAAYHRDFFEIFIARVGALHRAEHARRAGLHGQVNVIADFFVALNGLNDVGAKIARVRGGKADAAHARHLGGSLEEPGEFHFAGRWIGVGIYGLAEELHFGVAERGELAQFAENGIAGAASLRPARVRNDAVRAGLVAAFDDGEISAPGIVAAREFGLECFIGVGIEAGDTLFAGFELREQLRKFAVACGAADEIDPRRALKYFFAFLLRDAAEDADFFRLAGHFTKLAEPGKNFLRGFFGDAGGVVENERCGFDGIDLTITAGEQDAGDFFGVVVIHLAAESFEVERAADWCAGNKLRPRRYGGVAADEGIQTDVERFLHLAKFSLAHRPRRAGETPFQDKPALQMGPRNRAVHQHDEPSGELVFFEVEDFFGVVAMEAANHFRFGLRSQQVYVRSRRTGDFGVRDFIKLFFVHDGHPFVPVLASAAGTDSQAVAAVRFNKIGN